ncbi:AfsA-related hotdog domain-containing protein, partial [Nocardia tenerifensis]|uniref:AfsA-related hotdog domain-containing protein n=1 Tax=Nocardia tenerifensis TaxID=228006 RepID=UPI0026E560A7
GRARECRARRSVSEVFVCDRARIAPELFVIAVQLPRAHSLWSDGHYEYHDTLMAAEAVRQAAIMSGHDFFEIAPETVMVARSFDLAGRRSRHPRCRHCRPKYRHREMLAERDLRAPRPQRQLELMARRETARRAGADASPGYFCVSTMRYSLT